METLVGYTDCDFYDWFLSPSSSYSDQQIHLKLISILSSSAASSSSSQNIFLEKLAKNRVNSYPGGSFRALQLLAFWLSWTRALYSKNQQLVLSATLLEEIRLWSIGKEGKDDETGDSDGEEERKLALTLYEDFGKTQFEKTSGSTSSSHLSTNDSGLTLSGVEVPHFQSTANPGSLEIDTSLKNFAFNDKSAINVDSSPVKSPSKHFEVTPSMDVVLRYKEEGNEYYKTSKYDLALKSYQYSLRVYELLLQRQNEGEDQSMLNYEGRDDSASTLLPTLHSNIANTLWKLWSDEETAVDVNNEKNFDLIISHCELALRYNPSHVKAMYRLINCYLEKKELKKSFLLISSFLSQVKETNEKKLFERLKRKILALVIADLAVSEDSNRNIERFHFEDWNLSSNDILLLLPLLKRFQVSETIIHRLSSSLNGTTAVTGAGSEALNKEKEIKINNLKKKKAEINDDQSISTTNQDLFEEIPKKKDLSKQLSYVTKEIKIKSGDRKLIQQLKTIGNNLKTVCEKSSENIENDKIEICKSGVQVRSLSLFLFFSLSLFLSVGCLFLLRSG
jgi:tetratricopeptide (TPR) repeat protein